MTKSHAKPLSEKTLQQESDQKRSKRRLQPTKPATTVLVADRDELQLDALAYNIERTPWHPANKGVVERLFKGLTSGRRGVLHVRSKISIRRTQVKQV